MKLTRKKLILAICGLLLVSLVLSVAASMLIFAKPAKTVTATVPNTQIVSTSTVLPTSTFAPTATKAPVAPTATPKPVVAGKTYVIKYDAVCGCYNTTEYSVKTTDTVKIELKAVFVYQNGKQIYSPKNAQMDKNGEKKMTTTTLDLSKPGKYELKTYICGDYPTCEAMDDRDGAGQTITIIVK